MCCLPEVRLRGEGARMLGIEGMRYELWWSGKLDPVMAVVLIFEEDVLRLICVFAPQIGRRLEVRQTFCDGLKGEWDVHSAGELVM